MSDHDEAKVYEDLAGFLTSDRDDLRLASVSAIVAVKDRDGMEKIIKHGMVAPLARNSSRPGSIGVNSLMALVHLSSRGTSASQCVEDCLKANGISRMTEIVLSRQGDGDESVETWKKRVNFAMAMLANMTRLERGAVELVGRTLPDEPVQSEQLLGETVEDARPSKPTLELLLPRFLSSQYISPSKEVSDVDTKEELNNEAELDSRHDDPYQHFAAVLMNSTQVEAGRKFVVKLQREKESESTTSVLHSLLPQLRSTNPIRRRGVAGTLKNCCIDADSAWWLIEQVNVVKHILYPLAGPEELEVDEKRGMDPDLWLEGPDKVREPDHLTRLFLVEAILLLCASGRASRQKIRLSRTYVILKLTDMVEEQEDVSERINECVQYLRRDEEGTEEGSSDRQVEEELATPRFLALPAPSSAKQVGSNDDYDDVD